MLVDGYARECLCNHEQKNVTTYWRGEIEQIEQNKTNKYIIFLDNHVIDLDADRIVFDGESRVLKAYNMDNEIVAELHFVLGYCKNKGRK